MPAGIEGEASAEKPALDFVALQAGVAMADIGLGDQALKDGAGPRIVNISAAKSTKLW